MGLEDSKGVDSPWSDGVLWLDEHRESLFKGECEGEITKEKKGEKGFGYDPIFLPKGVDATFAQMTKKQKGAISHRGKSTKKLVEFLQKD